MTKSLASFLPFKIFEKSRLNPKASLEIFKDRHILNSLPNQLYYIKNISICSTTGYAWFKGQSVGCSLVDTEF